MKWYHGASLGLGVLVAAAMVIEWRSNARPILVMPRRAFAAPQSPTQRADAPAADPAPANLPPMSVNDALLRPFDLPFGEPTSLADVQKYLASGLGGPVVLDLAALDRLDLDPEDTVQLDLRGVRLKTGLKLLLDQVGLTWKVVAEDNLLILTDKVEAGEPIDHALRQLKAIHDEIHDLQDAVDDLRDLVEEDLGIEPETKPNATIFVRSVSRQSARPPQRPRPSRGSAPTTAGSAG